MVKLPYYQYSVIVGIILSDGSLFFSNNKNKNARFKLKQSYSHMEYLWFTFLILSHYCNSLPVCRKAVRNGNINYSIEYTTRALPCFSELYNLFYPKGVKLVPNNIYDLLTPVALAHLIMGDGLYAKGGLVICTDSFSVKDTIRLMNVLIIRYNLSCSIREHNKGQYRVYIYKQSMKSLTAIVKPYMHSSFYYKLGMNSEKGLHNINLLNRKICTQSSLSVIRHFCSSAPMNPFSACSATNINVFHHPSHPNYMYRSYSTNNFAYHHLGEGSQGLNKNFSSYLAGLIEADGTIAVHNKDSNTKKYNPKIAVVFNLVDEPLAKKLASITNAGTIYKKQNAGHVLWQIQKLEDVIKIINIINGYMRTPKIEALHRAIDWLNKFSNCNINCLNLDLSPIDSNAWLAGFTDGDGNFSINLIDRKKNGNITSKRVQAFFRLELRQTYHRDVSSFGLEQGGASYFVVLNKIACYLGVNLLSRTREQKDKVFYAFMVISHSAASHEKVINYFNKFPLFSSKYLAFKDWSYVVELSRLRAGKVLTSEEILEIKKIKEQFNSRRKLFDFSHLDNLI